MRTAKLRGKVLCLHSFGCYNTHLLDEMLRSVSFRFHSAFVPFCFVLFRFRSVLLRTRFLPAHGEIGSEHSTPNVKGFGRRGIEVNQPLAG